MGRWRTENFTIYVDVYTVCIVCLELGTQGGVDTLQKIPGISFIKHCF